MNGKRLLGYRTKLANRAVTRVWTVLAAAGGILIALYLIEPVVPAQRVEITDHERPGWKVTLTGAEAARVGRLFPGARSWDIPGLMDFVLKPSRAPRYHFLLCRADGEKVNVLLDEGFSFWEDVMDRRHALDDEQAKQTLRGHLDFPFGQFVWARITEYPGPGLPPREVTVKGEEAVELARLLFDTKNQRQERGVWAPRFRIIFAGGGIATELNLNDQITSMTEEQTSSDYSVDPSFKKLLLGIMGEEGSAGKQ